MGIKLKKLNEQVIVITGASSGIGLTTARMAAERGAKLVLVARNEEALVTLTNEINSTGGEAIYVVADVAKENELRSVAKAAIERFGQIDTWINNAGVSIYGRVLDVSIEDHRQLFETNYWGVVNGSRVACEYLRRGGALINVGSVLSDRAIPLQGTYSASKHAVKGFTDALRLELEEQGIPISVTLIKPSAIDTPYRAHAKNYLAVEPLNPPPVYAPETVAEAILHCCENPVREVYVGAGGRLLSAVGRIAPRLTDLLMESLIFKLQQSNVPSSTNRSHSLYRPSTDGKERGGYPGHIAESSIYTKASLHPLLMGGLAIGTGFAITAILGAGLGNKDLRRSIKRFVFSR